MSLIILSMCFFRYSMKGRTKHEVQLQPSRMILFNSQQGSHANLGRTLPDNTKQTLTIPAHSELDKGTLKATYRQAMRYIPESELQSHFYSE
jgi:hypothetical protein